MGRITKSLADRNILHNKYCCGYLERLVQHSINQTNYIRRQCEVNNRRELHFNLYEVKGNDNFFYYNPLSPECIYFDKKEDENDGDNEEEDNHNIYINNSNSNNNNNNGGGMEFFFIPQSVAGGLSGNSSNTPD